MSLVSFSFLLFILATAIVYFAFPVKYRWSVLLVMSLVFYWISSRLMILVMAGSAAVTYGIARWIHAVNTDGKQYLKEHGKDLTKEEKKALKVQTKKKARRILQLGIVLDLGVLLVLKYGNFFGGLARPVLDLPVLHFLLPIGISFYTLQAIAYMTDVYRGKIGPDRNFLKFLLFMSYFPQIIQGPIPRYSQLAAQLYEGHGYDYTRVTRGAQLMLWGYMKKIMIADRIAVPVAQIFDNYTAYPGPLLLFAGALYGLQVYTDFSGGMDIARGFSQMIGIELELNFNQPYFSRSVEEFWRRWHITLGGWMRDYVFYPLSLSGPFTELGKKARKWFGTSFGKKLPAFISMFIVYLLVGFWHGPEWKYVGYGIWNGMFIMTGIMFAELYEKAHQVTHIPAEHPAWKAFQMLRTFLICSMGRYFSRGGSFRAAVGMLAGTFRGWGSPASLRSGMPADLGLKGAEWVLIGAAVLVLFAVGFLHEKQVGIRERIAARPVVIRWIIYLAAVFCVMIFGLYGPSDNASAFIYGQF